MFRGRQLPDLPMLVPIQQLPPQLFIEDLKEVSKVQVYFAN